MILDNSFTKGDLVVHIDYGIGIYHGLVLIKDEHNCIEVIKLIYDNNDILYVDLLSIGKITKYIPLDGSKKLSKLGSTEWKLIKNKTKKKVKQLAFDLYKLYNDRQNIEGFKFSKDTKHHIKFYNEFEYNCTIDQQITINDVMKDMESNKVMDRLICGDVGFGKTEIAMRAAYKAVYDNKQVVVIVPTTVLSIQHFNNFKYRFRNTSFRICCINRFTSIKEKSDFIKLINTGVMDIIIGTNSIVNNSFKYKDLGLLIIDEEHKFGVNIKDKLKSMKIDIDIISLTATPIPRTLQLSLSCIRDISIIKTPPLNRKSIVTKILTFDINIIIDKIIKEIKRDGQVIIIHNNIKNIQLFADDISSKSSTFKVCVCHSKLNSDIIDSCIIDFINKKYNILVSTTIIESGIDIPGANTIIINDAQNFGISDLYQMRGRVGRRNKKAFCYLVVPDLHLICKDSIKRLNAICDNSTLGSGIDLAKIDLEIRGSGNLLGGQQTGFINKIGFNTYQLMLMNYLKNISSIKSNKEKVDIYIDVDIPYCIPDHIFNNEDEKLIFYISLYNEKNIDNLKIIEEKFKNYNLEVINNLFNIYKIRNICILLSINKIIFKKNILYLYFYNTKLFSNSEFSNLLKYLNTYKENCSLNQKNDLIFIKYDNIFSISNALDVVIKLCYKVKQINILL